MISVLLFSFRAPFLAYIINQCHQIATTFNQDTIIFVLFQIATVCYHRIINFRCCRIMINNKSIGKKLKELKKELDNLNYIFIKKRMPVSTYERLYAETEDKIKRLEYFKLQSTDHLKQFLNSGWRSIYDNLTRENKRTLWRNILDAVHVSPD